MKGPFGSRNWRIDNYFQWKLIRKNKPRENECHVRFCDNARSLSERHALCHKCRSREHRANHPRGYAYSNLKSSAAKRNIPFKLTFEEFKEFLNGNEYLILKGRKRDMLHVDRKDHTKGYELSNLQTLSARENSQKRMQEYGNPNHPF